MKNKILFVCRYNRFRSVIAEALFKKLNKNKNIKVKSAGIIKGSPIGINVRYLAKEFKLKIKKYPQGLTSPLMKWQNVTIIVGNDIHPSLFDKNKKFGKQVIIWKIPDAKTNNIKEIIEIANLIEKKIKEFVNRIER
ncbi:MAG: hypothetical protein IIA87_02135 [Nanoarchaeota archaeon]|nr:hypothetical protein [Nanoarchaeota archaeon]